MMPACARDLLKLILVIGATTFAFLLQANAGLCQCAAQRCMHIHQVATLFCQASMLPLWTTHAAVHCWGLSATGSVGHARSGPRLCPPQADAANLNSVAAGQYWALGVLDSGCIPVTSHVPVCESFNDDLLMQANAGPRVQAVQSCIPVPGQRSFC